VELGKGTRNECVVVVVFIVLQSIHEYQANSTSLRLVDYDVTSILH